MFHRNWPIMGTIAAMATMAFATPAHADHYTRSSCGKGYKDPINFYWDDRWSAGTVSAAHKATDMCGGQLNGGGDSCGSGQTYNYLSCGNAYRRHCTKRTNKRRFHVRIYSQQFKFVPAHEDQGCGPLGTVVQDGARFNPGRDNQRAWISIGCRKGHYYYWGNTLSINQACGVGRQASDGKVWIVD
ncbi:hypothetical protein LZC95_51710 [Pendulispora brunnea]|uniref:Uncharacterized protein n=1 Tax=Pendulispora brunnea TaxID=2905690 RepID=A0ABZ2K870_9BACT